MKNRYPTEYKTHEEAQQRKDLRFKVMAVGTPLRFHPVIVHGPNDGFMVVDLGWAEQEDLPSVK